MDGLDWLAVAIIGAAAITVAVDFARSRRNEPAWLELTPRDWDDDGGAVLVEFALIVPAFLFLVLGGLTVGLWMVEVNVLQHTAQEITVAGLAEDQAAAAAADVGATLVCYDPAGSCVPGALDGLSVTLEKTGSSYAPALGDITLTRSAVAAPTTTTTTTTVAP